MRFVQYSSGRRAAAMTIRVPLAELQASAQEVEIHDVGPFLLSRVFRANGYMWDDAEGVITKHFESS